MKPFWEECYYYEPNKDDNYQCPSTNKYCRGCPYYQGRLRVIWGAIKGAWEEDKKSPSGGVRWLLLIVVVMNIVISMWRAICE